MSTRSSRPSGIHPASSPAFLAADPLGEFFVWWDRIGDADIRKYKAVLAQSATERPLQRHFQAAPVLLVQHLGGGHGRWVIPQKRLGSEFVPDFLVGERSSAGLEWLLVELQSPRVKLFTRKGRATEQLDEGIRQVLDWRRWVANNSDYAQRARHKYGLALADLDDKADGLVLIGREADLTDSDNERRRQLGHDHRLKIHTYDWITREAQRRIAELAHAPHARQ